MVSGTVLLGPADRHPGRPGAYEPLAKAIIFMPMAISFVGAGVIWKFVYDYDPRAAGRRAQRAGAALGGQPVSFLTTPVINTLALILVGIWMWTGFSMTILAAALKGVPSEILEAARVDGATEIEVFLEHHGADDPADHHGGDHHHGH